MAHVLIHRIDERARRRLAVRAQREALPPQPERWQANLWPEFRRPWVSGWYPGTATDRMGRESIELRRARRAALEAGADPEAVEQLRLEDLIVTPELIEGSIGGVSFRTRWQTEAVNNTNRAVERAQAVPEEEYVVAGAPQVLTARLMTTYSTTQTARGPTVQAPVRIDWWELSDLAGLFSTTQLSIAGYGLVYEITSPMVDWSASPQTRISTHIIIQRGAIAPEIRATGASGTPGQVYGMTFSVGVTPMRRRER